MCHAKLDDSTQSFVIVIGLVADVAWGASVDGWCRISHESGSSLPPLWLPVHDHFVDWRTYIICVLILIMSFYLRDALAHSPSGPHLLWPEIAQSTFAFWRLSCYMAVSHLAFCFNFALIRLQNVKLWKGQWRDNLNIKRVYVYEKGGKRERTREEETALCGEPDTLSGSNPFKSECCRETGKKLQIVWYNRNNLK